MRLIYDPDNRGKVFDTCVGLTFNNDAQAYIHVHEDMVESARRVVASWNLLRAVPLEMLESVVINSRGAVIERERIILAGVTGA